ncbi:MAG: transglutaminase family protein [Spirochaetaceae bacterium]|jgi:transglutaminase-like putative cysteine protease|nr:transglutaminase family protein [Spirochaetaceae bacterium]
MKHALYKYHFSVNFSKEIFSHFFLLRCTPPHTHFQHVIKTECLLLPGENGRRLFLSSDCFGNIVQSGCILAAHDYLSIDTSGEINIDDTYIIPEDKPQHIFLYATELSAPGDEIVYLLKEACIPDNADIHKTAALLCEVAHKALLYMSGTTDTETDAETALKNGKGVCQDFAHILLALLRKKNILARYVAGFVAGEGYTHAWVEYHDDKCWRALDPTHNKSIETGYIKLSHGRDFRDCSIERGVFSGLAEQTMEIKAQVYMS